MRHAFYGNKARSKVGGLESCLGYMPVDCYLSEAKAGQWVAPFPPRWTARVSRYPLTSPFQILLYDVRYPHPEALHVQAAEARLEGVDRH